MDAKLTKFLHDTKALQVQLKFPPELFIYVDETPVFCDTALNTAVDRHGKNEVIV